MALYFVKSNLQYPATEIAVHGYYYVNVTDSTASQCQASVRQRCLTLNVCYRYYPNVISSDGVILCNSSNADECYFSALSSVDVCNVYSYEQ